MKTFTIKDLREVTTEKLAKDLSQLANNSVGTKGFKSTYVPSRTRWGPCTKLATLAVFSTQDVIDHINNLINREANLDNPRNVKRTHYLDALHEINKRIIDE